MSDVSRETPSYNCNIDAQIEQVRAGRRKTVRHGGKLCSGCYEEKPVPGQRYCKQCHADYEAERRRSERAELKRLRAESQER